MLLRADSLDATQAIAAKLSALARTGDIIVLAGEMGAGKTAFAQGFGWALGITDPITSPTFTLVHSYEVPGRRLVLHHADIYRLERTGDIDDLALHELAEFGGIVLVEWGDVAAGSLGDHLEVRITAQHDDVADLDDEHRDDEHRDDEHRDEQSGEGDDFGLDEHRVIELAPSGSTWAGRWERLLSELAEHRC